MKKYILLTASLLIFSVSLFSKSNSDIFNEANAAYKKGQYDTAVSLYESVLKTGFESPEVYFNLGNSYYKKKDIANAVLNYERAHKLAPGDEEINFNLQLAQAMVVDKINVLPEFFLKHWLKAFSELYSSDTWALFSIGFFIVCLLFVLLYLFANLLWLKKVGFWLGIFVLFLSVVSFGNSYREKQVNQQLSGAVVMSASVTLKSSPDEDGTDLFVLHEGAKIWVKDRVGDWLKVNIADGNSGWLKKTEIEEI
jgi:tetratricopeptide (TPR) repeat protein